MKKVKNILIVVFTVLFFMVFDNNVISAKEIIVRDSIIDFSNEEIGVIEIYDNSEIIIGYKYGLRKVTLKYCKKGPDCDALTYKTIEVMESDEYTNYKNTSGKIKLYSFIPKLEKKEKYKFKVEAYFGSSERYNGTENISSGFLLYYLEVDSKDKYITGTDNSNIGDSSIANLLGDIGDLINFVFLPIAYIALGLILVVKGAILGVQIVKSADDPSVRKEKLGALKWMLIGVAIGTTASTIVGLLTGFFEEVL